MTQQPVKVETVTLTEPHTHRGRPCNKGGKIDVWPHEKAFLAKRNKIVQGDATEVPATKK